MGHHSSFAWIVTPAIYEYKLKWFNSLLHVKSEISTAAQLIGGVLVTNLLTPLKVNSLWPSDEIWGYWSGPTLPEVMACCLTAPSHYSNQCWLQSVRFSDNHLRQFHKRASAINHYSLLENYLSKNSFKSPRDQRVKIGHRVVVHRINHRNRTFQIYCHRLPGASVVKLGQMIVVQWHHLWPLLLTWIIFNSSMDN